MDPFIECQVWDDFHGRFVSDLADALVPQVRPNYVVRYERRVYVESDPDDPHRFIKPDVALARKGHEETTGSTKSCDGLRRSDAPAVVLHWCIGKLTSPATSARIKPAT